MKELTFYEVGELVNITASYIDNKDAICEELDYLEIEYSRHEDDVFKLIAEFRSDEFIIDDDLYQVTDLVKVENYNKKD